jgi:hypothetical protein
MIEANHKRRASQPSFPAIELPDDDAEPPSDEPPRRVPTRSEVFLKAR